MRLFRRNRGRATAAPEPLTDEEAALVMTMLARARELIYEQVHGIFPPFGAPPRSRYDDRCLALYRGDITVEQAIEAELPSARRPPGTTLDPWELTLPANWPEATLFRRIFEAFLYGGGEHLWTLRVDNMGLDPKRTGSSGPDAAGPR